jgi:hypothetical protein
LLSLRADFRPPLFAAFHSVKTIRERVL